MTEAPLTERVLEVDQLLGELVEPPVLLGLAIHDEPRGGDALVERPRAVDRGRRRIDIEAVSHEQADRRVVDARLREQRLQVGAPLAVMRLDVARDLVAEQELDLAVLRRLESRR